MSIVAALVVLAEGAVATGTWKLTQRTTVAATPSLSMPPPVERLVITDGDSLRTLVVTEFLGNSVDHRCRIRSYDDRNGEIRARQTCRSKHFGPTQWTLEGRYTAVRIEARVVIMGHRNGRPETVTQQFEAVQLADGQAEPAAPIKDRHLVARLGEWLKISDRERIKFDGIHDSRCPRDATCFWAGNVTVYFVLQTGEGREGNGKLSWPLAYLPDDSPTACALGRRMTLTGVEPERVTQAAIPDAKYRLALSVGDC
jgi:hypothetical protein